MDIVTGIAAVAQAISIAKDLREMDKEIDRAEFKLKIADLTSALADAKIALVDAQDSLGDRARHHFLKQVSEEVALGEATMPVLREGRVVWDLALHAQPAEPPVRQIEVHLFAEPPLRVDRVAVADDQHPDHQLRVDRRPARRAVETGKVRPKSRQIDKPVDRPQQMVCGNVPVNAELVEQAILRNPPLAHHRPSLRCRLHATESRTRRQV